MCVNKNKVIKISFGDEVYLKHHFRIFQKVIVDRRSMYSVSIGIVKNKEDIKCFLKKTKGFKNHNKATHHSWAVRISNNNSIYESKNDDGENGAGNVILRILQNKNMMNIIVCVIRWYGGIKLGTDRFKHIQNATVFAIEQDKN